MAREGDATTRQLRIDNLHLRHHCIDQDDAGHLLTVASVFMAQYSESPRDWALHIEPSTSERYQIGWPAPTVAARRLCANMQESVEDAAYCLALAAVDTQFGLVALRRAHTGTAFDWVLIPIGADPGEDMDLDWERDDITLLEVSGIDQDTNYKVRARMDEKEERARKKSLPYTQFGCIVGFRNARLVFRQLG
jgi:hypothetical protein